MNLLDEEVRMPQGSDAKFLAKVVERHKGNTSAFGGPGETHPPVGGHAFLIRHYAGDVVRRTRTTDCPLARPAFSAFHLAAPWPPPLSSKA